MYLVAKAAITGTFTFTDSSFTVASDQMPWKDKANFQKKTAMILKLIDS
jgi:hypothetical protein